jgi:hypothetical protein
MGNRAGIETRGHNGDHRRKRGVAGAAVVTGDSAHVGGWGGDNHGLPHVVVRVGGRRHRLVMAVVPGVSTRLDALA